MVTCTQNSFYFNKYTVVDVLHGCTLMPFVIMCGGVHIGCMENNTEINENNGCLDMKKCIHQHAHAFRCQYRVHIW